MYLSHLFPCLNSNKKQLANRKGAVDKTNSHLRKNLNLSDNKQPQVFSALISSLDDRIIEQ